MAVLFLNYTYKNYTYKKPALAVFNSLSAYAVSITCKKNSAQQHNINLEGWLIIQLYLQPVHLLLFHSCRRLSKHSAHFLSQAAGVLRGLLLLLLLRMWCAAFDPGGTNWVAITLHSRFICVCITCAGRCCKVKQLETHMSPMQRRLSYAQLHQFRQGSWLCDRVCLSACYEDNSK